MNANDLKDQGNMYFAARRFNDAVECYTKAIVSTAGLFSEAVTPLNKYCSLGEFIQQQQQQRIYS